MSLLNKGPTSYVGEHDILLNDDEDDGNREDDDEKTLTVGITDLVTDCVVERNPKDHLSVQLMKGDFVHHHHHADHHHGETLT